MDRNTISIPLTGVWIVWDPLQWRQTQWINHLYHNYSVPYCMYSSPLSTIPFRVKTNIFQLRVYIWSLTPPYTHEGPTTTLHDEMMLYSTLLPVQFAVFSTNTRTWQKYCTASFPTNHLPPSTSTYSVLYALFPTELSFLNLVGFLIVKSKCTLYLQFKKTN